MFYWNYFHESLLGEDKIVGLNQLARLSGMDRAAMKLLKAKGLRKRLMAIITLGHLGSNRPGTILWRWLDPHILTIDW